MKKSFTYYIILAAAALWCLMLFLPPLTAAIEAPSSSVSKPIYRFYATICHQYETRSLHIFGYKIAVCARCFGIYAGFFAGCLLYPLIFKRQKFHGLSGWCLIGLPMALDVFFDVTGIHASTIITRLATGLFFGYGAAAIILPFLISGLSEIIYTKNILKGATNELKT
jgi:uncharacterized membrane protein